MASVTHLTTAMASNRGTDFVNANGGVTGTNITGTIYSNGLSLSVAPPGAGGGMAIYGGTTSQSTGTMTFANSNGVTFGLNTNGSMTASVQTNYQAPGAYLTTAMASDYGSNFAGLGETIGTTAGTDLKMTVDSGGVNISHPKWITTYANDLTSGRAGVGATIGTTVGTDLKMTVDTNGVNISHPKWLTTTAAQSVQPVAASGSNGSFNFSTLQFVTGNGASFYTDATGMRLSYTVPGATVFSNSNNVSFGINGSTVTATATVAASAALDHSHGNPTLALTNLTGTTASASNGFTLSLSAAAPGAAAENNWMTLLGANVSSNSSASGSTIGWSGSNVTLAGTNGSQIIISAPATSSLVGTNGISVSTNGSTISISPVYMSYHAVHPYAFATHTTSWAQSTSGVYPFVISQPLSMDRVRMLYSGSVAASSTQATLGGTSLSMSGATSHNLVFYSRGAGANSLSLQYVTSTQHVDLQILTISYSSTRLSYSHRLTLGSNSFTKNYSASTNSVQYHTSNLTDLTGARYLDIPAGLSLSAGQWWVAYGRSTASATQANSISVATRMLVSHNSMFGHSQNTLAIGMIGDNTNSSVGFLPAHGSFSLGGAAGTTSSIGMANVSTAASNHMLHMQFMQIT